MCYFNFNYSTKSKGKLTQQLCPSWGTTGTHLLKSCMVPTIWMVQASFICMTTKAMGRFDHSSNPGRTPTNKTGQLLHIIMAWAQYCIGTSTPLLQDSRPKLPHFESCWLESLRQYLREIEGGTPLTNPMVEPLQREGDRYLMASSWIRNRSSNL